MKLERRIKTVLLDAEQLQMKFLSNVELFEITKGLEVDEDTISVPVFRGFSFLSPFDFTFTGSERNTYFLSAMVNNSVVGVMKLKRYHLKTHMTVLEEDKDKYDNYVAIRYMDVREDARRQGIATMLFESLNAWIEPNQKIVMSALTMLGKKAKLDEKGKKVMGKAKFMNI